jgi:hypothetical protein
VAGPIQVLGAYPGRQRKFRDAVRNQREISYLLDVTGEQLKKSRSGGAVVVVVTAV